MITLEKNNLSIINIWNEGISQNDYSMENSFNGVESNTKKPPMKELPKRKINNIIIYTSISRENEIKNRALLIYNDGTIKNVNENIFTKELAKIAKERKVDSYIELEKQGILKFTTVKALAKNWDNYFENDESNKQLKTA